MPQSAAELLPLLQPATKSLAQMLAGNVKASGQAVHARNVLAQAERLVAERAVDRLPPAAREEFFEQLARLKLTVADAEAMLEEQEPVAATPTAPVAEQNEISAERLRELALSLAVTTSSAAVEQARMPVPPASREETPSAAAEETRTAPASVPAPRLGVKSRERLRLKSVVAKPENEGEG